MLALQVAPSLSELVPWTDRRGRFHPLRAATFGLLTLPAAWLLFRWAFDMLGPRAVNAAIHSTGYWTIWLLVASLCVTPLKALAGMPNIVVIRRMVGNAALIYAGIHLTLYAVDQNWRLIPIVREILTRFYLTIGVVALLGLAVLGATSTDGWARALGRNWKRLHKIVYAIAVLGLVHYMLQSKLDVSQALLAAGVFVWLMLWRTLPAGADREPLPLLGITLLAALLTIGFEYAWYRFGTKINPMKVLSSELEIEYGLHPAGRVLAAGLVATAASVLVRAAQGPVGNGAWFTMGVFALGGLVEPAAAFVMGWTTDEAGPDGGRAALIVAGWVVLLAALGLQRWRLRRHAARHGIEAVAIACITIDVLLASAEDRSLATSVAALAAIAAVAAVSLFWPRREAGLSGS